VLKEAPGLVDQVLGGSVTLADACRPAVDRQKTSGSAWALKGTDVAGADAVRRKARPIRQRQTILTGHAAGG
jgi:hypothetical protein